MQIAGCNLTGDATSGGLEIDRGDEFRHGDIGYRLTPEALRCATDCARRSIARESDHSLVFVEVLTASISARATSPRLRLRYRECTCGTLGHR